jgi:hypothetical protein
MVRVFEMYRVFGRSWLVLSAATVKIGSFVCGGCGVGRPLIASLVPHCGYSYFNIRCCLNRSHTSKKKGVLVWVVMENCDLSSDLTLRNVCTRTDYILVYSRPCCKELIPLQKKKRESVERDSFKGAQDKKKRRGMLATTNQGCCCHRSYRGWWTCRCGRSPFCL